MRKLIIALAFLSAIFASNIAIGEVNISNRAIAWEAPVNLSNNTASSMHPAIALWENYLHVVWEDNEEGYSGVYYIRSSSSGVSWDIKQRLSSSYSAQSPAIAVWQNYVHVVWIESTGVYYRRSNDNGTAGSWTLRKIIASSSSCSRARIALNQIEVYVTWCDDENVYLTKSMNNGLDRDSSIVIAQGYVEKPDIASWNNSIYIVWQEKKYYWDEYWNVYCNLSLDKGTTWTEKNITNNTNTASINPAIAANESGAWVVWQDNRDNNWEIYWANLTTVEHKKLASTTGESKNPASALNNTSIFVVWSDNSEGNFEIYLAISNNNGTTWSCERVTYTNICISDCPAIGVTTLNHIFWHDNIDGDFDVYYIRNKGPVYGVALSCPQEQKELWFNDFVNYTITVKSLANREDTIDLEIDWLNSSIDLNNWSANLSVNYVILAPDNELTINLTVKAYEPEITSEAKVVVLARSQNDSTKSDSLTTVTRLEPIYNVSLACSNNRDIIDPGKFAYYAMGVYNLGNRRDTVYLLDLIQVSSPSGFDSWLSDYELELEPNEQKNFWLYVKAPNKTKGIAEVKVRALSKGNNAQRNYITTYTAIGIENFTIDLTCEESTKYGDPGETLNYTIKIWNLVGSGEIELELNTTSWNASLSKNKIYLATGAKTEIYLLLKIPENALSGERLLINLTSKLENYTNSIVLEAIVTPVFNITAIYDQPIVIEAGRNETINITFRNNGNIADWLKLELANFPKNWIVNLSVTNFSLLPNEIKYLEMLIFTSRATPAGEYYLELNVTTKNTSFILNLTIKVAQYYDFELACEKPVMVGAPNTTIKYNIEVRNLGNGNDIILIRSDFKWLENISSTLNLTELKNISVNLRIPYKVDNFSYEFELLVQSQGNKTLIKSLVLTLIISLPDFRITNATFSNLKPIVGEEVRIIVSVVNEGNITVQNVLVFIYENNILYNSTEIPVLRPNDTVNLHFKWYAKAGSYVLRIEVDPEDSFPELYEDNNVFIQKFEVFYPELWNIYLYVAIAIIVAIAITLSLRVLAKKIKKRKTIRR